MENLKKEIQKIVNLYKSHKFSEAEKQSKKLIEKNPEVTFLYNLLGLILTSLRKNDEAIKYYEIGIKIQPNNAMINNNLATSYKIKRDYIKAEKYYKKSIEFNNKLPDAQNNLGNLYIDLNKHSEAITCFLKAIELNPNFSISYYNLGILFKSIGKFKESAKYLNQAIKLYPKFYNAHRAYSQINKYKKKDNHIKKMKELFNETNITNSGKMLLAFALGKAFDDVKNYNDAFKYYSEGNKLRRKEINFSLKNENEEFSNIKKTFKQSFFNEHGNIGNYDSTPIFILGMPRSGTTLVEQIISSHPKVYGGDELIFFNNFVKNFFYKDATASINNDNLNNEANFKNIGEKYINEIKKISGNSEKVTDKLPINFKWVGFISLIFPKAKVIHCIRNPKDTCISIFKNYFTNDELNYAYNLEELVEFYNLYQCLMNFWKKMLPNFIIEVNYENLITYPKKEIPKLIKSCDLLWDEKCMKFYKNKRAIKTASDTQVRNKIYKSSVGSWKNYKKYLESTFNKLNH